MFCTAFLTFTMLLGVCKYRIFFYIIPWAICLDKFFEYPIVSDTIISEYGNTFLAFFSQSSIFQIAFFSCQNLFETVVIFWVLEIRSISYIHKALDLEMESWLYPSVFVFCLIFCFMQFLINNFSQKAFIAQKKLKVQMSEFKDILGSFPEGILIYLPKKSEFRLPED